MDIEFAMQVVDKNNKDIGTVGKIFMDTWTGKPRKYLVTRNIPHAPDEIFMVPPE
jgi:sporulation protein YlmC with PRC-barrel domain